MLSVLMLFGITSCSIDNASADLDSVYDVTEYYFVEDVNEDEIKAERETVPLFIVEDTTEEEITTEATTETETVAEPETTVQKISNVKEDSYDEEPEPVIDTEISSGTKYVLNTNTEKFHYPSCNSVKQIKPENYQEYFGSRSNVIAQGFVPCKNCNP